MPRYFFHLRDGEDILLDPEGRELDDREAVERMALDEARSIIADEARGGRIELNARIDVETEEGELVHRLDFVNAVEIVVPPEAPPKD